MHIKKIIAMVIPLVMAISLVVPTGINSETSAEEIIITESRGLTETDVPTWNIGDSWTYEYYVWQNMTSGDQSWVLEEVTYTVSEIGYFTFRGNTSYAYNLTMTGDVIDGEAESEGYTFDIYAGSAHGWSLIRVSDLAPIADNQTHWMRSSYLFFNQDMWVTQTRANHPPSENYNFPLSTGDKFWTNGTTKIDGLYNYTGMQDERGTFSDQVDNIQDVHVSENKETVNMPGGDFETFYVPNFMNASDGSDTGKGYLKNWYNETVENFVYQRGNITNFMDRDTYWIYRYMSHSQSPDAGEQSITPSPARIGDTVTISGEFPDHPNEAITITQPEGAEPQSQWTTTTDGSGQYTLDITVPLAVDDTDDPEEFSSVGFVTTVNNGTADDMVVSSLVILPKMAQIPLEAGWNYISAEDVPYKDYADNELLTILEHPDHGIIGNYDRIMYFNSTTKSWQSFKQGRLAHYNHIDNWNLSMGFWIYMNTADTLSVKGMPSYSQKIVLHPGWNMVGYICDTSWTASDLFPPEGNKIGVYNSSMEYNIEYTEDLSTVTMVEGGAYWVYNSGSTTISVTA